MQSASATPKNADSTSPLSARNALHSGSFLLTRDNVLWLLSCRDFYHACPSFKPFLAYVEKLSEFIKRVNIGGAACKKCDAARAYKAQSQLLNAFAERFIAVHDAGKLDELLRLRQVVERNGRRADKVMLAYAGKATKNRERVIIVE